MILTKKIIPVNTYRPRTHTGRVTKKFDEPYLRKVAETSNKMLEAGLRIPLPFDHHKEARPRTKEQQEEYEQVVINQSKPSYTNAGYWTKFWVAPDEEGIPSLYGQADVPGEKSDTDSAAYKLSTTNHEVSVSIAENFEDGLGRTWTDGLLHVAVVNHAVVPNQTPFEEVPEGVTIVNMSMVYSEKEGEGLIEELKSALRKVKIMLPGSTDKSTFLRDLLVAVTNIPESSDDRLEPAPIYMSIGEDDMPLTEAQAKALVDTKAVNPATNKPFTMEDLGFKVKTAEPPKEILASLAEKDKKIDSLTQLVQAFRNKVVKDSQAMIEKRIANLIDSKVITKEYADANLRPKVEFQMSIVDGNISDHPLEVTLSALEAIAPKPTSNSNNPFPGTAEIIPLPDDGSGNLSDDEINKALDAAMSDGNL